MKYRFGKFLVVLMQASILSFLTITGVSLATQISATSPLTGRQISVEPDCNIRLVEPSNGQAVSLSLENLELQWLCISSDDGRVGFHGMAAQNPYNKYWMLDWSLIVGGADTKREERWLYRWFGKNYKIVQLNSVNSSGYAIIDRTQTTTGSIPGELDIKAQSSGPIIFSFCLVRPPKALCGNGHLGQKQSGASENRSSYAIEILRSIEFVE